MQTRGSLRLENCQFLQKHVCQRVYVLLSLHVLFLFCLHNYYLLTILYIFKSYYSCGGAMIAVLGCVSLRKSKIGFLNPKESKNRFCVSLLNRSIQDLSDWSWCEEESTSRVDSSVPLTRHNPRDLEWILRFLWRPWSERSLIDLYSKETQNSFLDSFGFKNPILNFLKETLPEFRYATFGINVICHQDQLSCAIYVLAILFYRYRFFSRYLCRSKIKVRFVIYFSFSRNHHIYKIFVISVSLIYVLFLS